jgi:integrase
MVDARPSLELPDRPRDRDLRRPEVAPPQGEGLPRTQAIPREQDEYRPEIPVGTPPRVPRAEAATLTPLQLSRLRAAVRGHALEGLFVLAMLTGMRRGELLVLRWGAVDLDLRVV